MKRNRLIAGAVCAAVAGTLTLTACSDGGDGASDGGDKEITFMFRGGPDEKAAYEAAIEKYTADTGVKVKVIVTDADQYATKLQAAVAGNNVPDVFYIEQATPAVVRRARASSMDITEQVEASGVDLDNIWEYGVDSYRFDGTLQGTPDGRLYGLPKDVGPFSFGYNKTMLEAAGIPLPDKDIPLHVGRVRRRSASSSPSDTDGDGARRPVGHRAQRPVEPAVAGVEQRRRLDQRRPHRGHRGHPRVRRGAAEVRGPHQRRQGHAVRVRRRDARHVPALDGRRDRLLPGRPVGRLGLQRPRLRVRPDPLADRR